MWGCPGGSVVKNLPANAGVTGDAGLIPGSGRSPGGVKSSGNLSHSNVNILKNYMYLKIVTVANFMLFVTTVMFIKLKECMLLY